LPGLLLLSAPYRNSDKVTVEIPNSSGRNVENFCITVANRWRMTNTQMLVSSKYLTRSPYLYLVARAGFYPA
jgi:hypothetical protein